MSSRKLPAALLATLAAGALPALAMAQEAPAVSQAEPLAFGDGTGPGSVSDPLVPEARFTALHLLQRQFSDLDAQGRWRTMLAVRPIDGATMPESGAGLSQSAGDPPFEMQGASSLVVREGRTVWGFALGGGVLVADQVLPVPFVSDALFVQTDPGREPVLGHGFAIAPGVPAALVVDGHDNAEESYRSHSLVAFARGRLSPVYEGPDLYSATFPDKGCEARAHAQALSGMHPLASRHAGRADIAVTVTESAECLSDDSVAPLPVKTFRFILKWDARRGAYRGGSPALDALNDRRRGE